MSCLVPKLPPEQGGASFSINTRAPCALLWMTSIRQYDSCDTGQFRQREHRCRPPRTSGSDVPVWQHEWPSSLYREYKCPCGGLWCRMWQFYIFIGNRRQQKSIDIGRCVNEDSVSLIKQVALVGTTTRGVLLARQGCWSISKQRSLPPFVVLEAIRHIRHFYW